MERKIVGIAGLARAGKDTFAGFLSEALHQAGVPVVIDRFAAPLKGASALLHPSVPTDDTKEQVLQVPPSYMFRAAGYCLRELGLYDVSLGDLADVMRPYYRPELKEFHISRRRFEQLLGTELVRAANPEAFAERIGRRSVGVTLVPDLRFPNELRVTTHDVFIFNPRIDGREVPEHESEAMAKGMDAEVRELAQETFGPLAGENLRGFYLVPNDGSLEDLKRRAREYARYLQGE